MKAGKAPSGNISGGSGQGEARNLAASKVGLGSGKTLEAAQKVVAQGAPRPAKTSANVYMRGNPVSSPMLLGA